MKIALVLLFAFLANIPFGWLRRNERKFTFKWFLYIHLPIPFIIALRVWLGINPWWIPVVIAVAVAGQVVGSRFLRLNAELS
jgi:hypothetical protein